MYYARVAVRWALSRGNAQAAKARDLYHVVAHVPRVTLSMVQGGLKRMRARDAPPLKTKNDWSDYVASANLENFVRADAPPGTPLLHLLDSPGKIYDYFPVRRAWESASSVVLVCPIFWQMFAQLERP